MHTRSRTPSRPDRLLPGALLAVLLVTSGCGAGRAVAIGPLPDPGRSAQEAATTTRLDGPARIEFRWELNEAGSRVDGVGIARVEPPYQARLDLFLDNGEGVVTAALVGDDLRLPHGAPDDVLPPVELMWGTLGVFRPIGSARLVDAERLEGGGERYRYSGADGADLRFDLVAGRVERLELLKGSSVVQWVQLTSDDGAWPAAATYRNLTDYRELKITRTAVVPAESFDPSIWDPREQ